MATSGAVTSILSGGTNLAQNVKTIGVNQNAVNSAGQLLSAKQQQANIVAAHRQSIPKGENLSVTITNGGGNAENFVLFDVCGIVKAYAGVTNGSDIVIDSNFAGIAYGTGSVVANGYSGYNTLKSYLVGGRFGVIGTNDTYSNNAGTLTLSTKFWVNGFYAITGSVPAGGSLTVLFNIPAHGNF